MIGGLDPGVFVLLGVALLLGALVQSVVGLGVGLVAAPVITLAAPQLMPGVMIVQAFVLPCLTLVRDHHDIDWHGLTWSLPFRVVGTSVGVWVVGTFSQRQLGVFIGTIVLAAVLLTWRAVTVPVNRRTLGAAGFVGGVTGTATSIGGPPFALLYQHRPPTQIRTTMAVYFLIGAAISLAGLTLSGDLTRHQVAVAGLLLPAIGAGALAGVPLRRRCRRTSSGRRSWPSRRPRPWCWWCAHCSDVPHGPHRDPRARCRSRGRRRRRTRT